MRRHVFGLGLMQVVLTMVGGHRRGSLLSGGDGPALVGYGLADRAGALGRDGDEQYRHHGQADGRAAELESRNMASGVMGVLLFQDLAVVPLLVHDPGAGSASSETSC